MGIIIKTGPGPTDPTPPPAPPEIQAACPHEEGYIAPNGDVICLACGAVVAEGA